MTSSIVIVCENRPRATPYLEALKAAGANSGDLVLVTPHDEPSLDPEALAAQARGLLLCGGEDLEPWRYGEEAIAGIDLELAPTLDALEWGLLTGAQERHTPVWGICRGCQMINVFLGGTLWQDLPHQHPSDIKHNVPQPQDRIAHDVTVTATDEALGARLGSERVAVNSRHHQAICRLGKDVIAVAQAPDEVIEAITLPASGPWWVRAVQWHPENLVERPLELALWRDFVAAADLAGTMRDTKLRRRAG